jgi:DNA-binding CsgD family transcriptional regulator
MDFRTKLSDTEQLIVRLVCDECLSRKEIATTLFRSAETISSHMKNIFSKLHITKVTELSKIYFTSVSMILLMLLTTGIEHDDFLRIRRYRRKVRTEHIIYSVTVHGT